MSVNAHRKTAWWNSRRIEFVLIVARLPLTMFLTYVAWVDGPRWMFFLGLFVVIGLSIMAADDLRTWRRRRPVRR